MPAEQESPLADRDANDFSVHQGGYAIGWRIDAMRDGFKALALGIVETTPLCREQSTALTRLEEACFWAIEALHRKGASLNTGEHPVISPVAKASDDQALEPAETLTD